MIDISVNLGSFKVNLDQLMDIKQGGLYEFNVDKDQDLELYIGEEKIADAKIVIHEEKYHVQITNLCGWGEYSSR